MKRGRRRGRGEKEENRKAAVNRREEIMVDNLAEKVNGIQGR